MTASTVTLDTLLDELHQPDEHTSINHQRDRRFTSRVLPARRVPAAITDLPDDADVWYGVNPVRAGTRGRGTVTDVTRLAALWADLDVKDGGMPTFDSARAVVAVLSEMLGTEPTWLVATGHGLQPVWRLDESDPLLTLDEDEKRAAATALLRRWGRLVASVAAHHDGHVDNVYDLPRILRAPGTTNHKNPDTPVPVLAVARGGHPLGAVDVDDTLLAYGVPETAEDRERLGETVSPSEEWHWAEHTCIYMQKTITGWSIDTPADRHPWLVSQATRLAAGVRNGCLTRTDHDDARRSLAARFRSLLAHDPVRQENRGEVAAALEWGRDRVAAMTETRVRREIGDHPHQFEDLTPTAAAPPARHLTAVATDGTSALAPEQTPENEDEEEDQPPPATTSTVHQLRRPSPNEDSTALALVDSHAGEIRYNPESGRWLVWDGHRWAWDKTGHVHELVRQIARHLPGGEGWAAYTKRALSYAGNRAVTGLAATDPRVVAPLASLDADPYALNTPGGTVDLTTGTLRPADPDALHTRSTTVVPDAGMPAPRWQRFLADTFADDPAMTRYVQRLLGVSTVGVVLEQVLPFAHGPGANGKTVLFEVAATLLGIGETGYAASIPSDMLVARAREDHPATIAQLSGVRLAVGGELEQGARFAEAKVKMLTGGDPINARFMAKNPFTFIPTHTLWLHANHLPEVRAGGPAFWRRIKQLPFLHTVPENQRVANLREILVQEEGPAILAWIVRGAVDYLRHGLDEPTTVTVATEAYRHETDTVGQFVEDRCATGDANAQHMHVRTTELRQAYETWCATEGVEAMSVRSLTQTLRARFGVVTSKGSKGVRFYSGIRLDEVPPGRGEVPPTSDDYLTGW